MFTKPHKKGFTLVEMLIVIVIIGVLAAALIPRLTSARGRANDVARKASLQQIATALVSYQIDHGFFPITGGPLSLSGINDALIKGGLASVPGDPSSTTGFLGITETAIPAGEFGYTPITKNGIPNNGFVLMAATETEGGSNRVYTGNITSTTDATSIIPCKSFANGNPGNENGVCTYYQKTGANVLRYIAIY